MFGSSNSGKSKFAEDYVCQRFQEDKKYYLATMKIMDEDGIARVERHKRQREGKGFFTIEKTQNILEVTKKYDFSDSVVLLECISNLVANALFDQEQERQELKKPDELVQSLAKEIEAFSKETKSLVIVSSIDFDGSDAFDEETKQYVQIIYDLNQVLFEIADEVYEIHQGKEPLIRKQEK